MDTPENMGKDKHIVWTGFTDDSNDFLLIMKFIKSLEI